MQSKTKFKAAMCLKFGVSRYFFQDARSVILVLSAFEKQLVLVMLTEKGFFKVAFEGQAESPSAPASFALGDLAD